MLFPQSFPTALPCLPHTSPPVLADCLAAPSLWRPLGPEGHAELHVHDTVHGGDQPAKDSQFIIYNTDKLRLRK